MNKKGSSVINTVLSVLTIIIIFLVLYFLLDYNKQLKRTYDAKRMFDLTLIANEIYTHIIINNKDIPKPIDGELRMIGTSKKDNCKMICQNQYTENECLNLTQILSFEDDKVFLPLDPEMGKESNTFYAIKRNENNRIEIYSCASSQIYRIKVKK